MQEVARAARALAGLGPGLTPAGDDYLAGVLLASWAIGSEIPRPVAVQIIVQAAAGRTSVLSTALLRAASRGEAARPWHGMVRALARSEAPTALRAAEAVCRLGHSSGIWSLAGFLDTVLDATEGAGSSPPPPQRQTGACPRAGRPGPRRIPGA
ncbi:MAG: DUF2877 domain-containing protein [Anaerolineales bacterium]